LERNARRNYFGDRADDLRWTQVTPPILIPANSEDSRMGSAGNIYQIVKVLKIAMVIAHHDSAVLDRVNQMHGIRLATVTHIRRNLHIMTSLP